MRDDFLSVASHELKTPVASLQLMIQGMDEGSFGPAPPDFVRPLQIMVRQSTRLKTLIRKLLDVSALDRGPLALRPEWLDLATLVRESLEARREELVRAGCTVTLEGVSARGRWDPVLVEQIFADLLSNAMKFGAGKPIEIEVGPLPRGGVRLVVVDHGIGIAHDRISQIFDRFERAVSAENYGGMGLGLYLVKRIVGGLGGVITVESSLGMGARFTVDLPRESGSPSHPRAPDERIGEPAQFLASRAGG